MHTLRDEIIQHHLDHGHTIYVVGLFKVSRRVIGVVDDHLVTVAAQEQSPWGEKTERLRIAKSDVRSISINFE